MSQPPFFRPGAVFSARESAGSAYVPGKGTFPQQFERDAFAGVIGKIVPFRSGGEIIGHARVLAADVEDDGSSVLFTYEITDLDPGQPGDIGIPG